MANLERRIEVLERGAQPDDAIAVIVRQIVNPGEVAPENRFCQIEGVMHTKREDESPSDFDARMLGLAEDIGRSAGRPIRIIRSSMDIKLQASTELV